MYEWANNLIRVNPSLNALLVDSCNVVPYLIEASEMMVILQLLTLAVWQSEGAAQLTPTLAHLRGNQIHLAWWQLLHRGWENETD